MNRQFYFEKGKQKTKQNKTKKTKQKNTRERKNRGNKFHVQQE